jgi:Na+/melibiose symporter-like transporter
MKKQPRPAPIKAASPLEIKKRNFFNVQMDAIGIGLANAAIPFLPVFLARLGASNFQVGLLTSMPAFTGLMLTIFIGSFLQRQRNIVPWYSVTRFITVLAFTLTGLIPFFFPRQYVVVAVLALWAIVTIPQTLVAVGFTVVMNAVAGPEGRYNLMSRRWSILGLTTSIATAIVGAILEKINFPLDYQVVFMGLSVGGLISFYFTNRIHLAENEPPDTIPGLSPVKRLKEYLHLVRGEKPFLTFTSMRFVFLSGTALATPLFPLYYVRVVNANDAWIGVINTVQTAVLLVGYLYWAHQTKRRGSRFVLLITTSMIALYPALTALTQQVGMVTLYAGISGIFQAGIDLVFFDELMKKVPPKHSVIFVSFDQSLQYVAAIAAPLIGTLLSEWIGIGGGLFVSAGLRFLGVLLFATHMPKRQAAQEANPAELSDGF